MKEEAKFKLTTFAYILHCICNIVCSILCWLVCLFGLSLQLIDSFTFLTVDDSDDRHQGYYICPSACVSICFVHCVHSFLHLSGCYI